jgi:arylsulfatase A-like enzyme
MRFFPLHSRFALSISLISGLLLGMAGYAEWFYHFHSIVLAGFCLLIGSLAGPLLMMATARGICYMVGGAPRDHELVAALAVVSLLIIYLSFPLRLFIIFPYDFDIILPCFGLGLFLIITSAAVLHGKGKRKILFISAILTAVIFLMGGIKAYRLLIRPEITLTPFPQKTSKQPRKQWWIDHKGTTRTGLALEVGSAIESVVLLKPSSQLHFELGVVHPEKELAPVRLRVMSVLESGQSSKILDKLVARNQVSWERFGANLTGLTDERVLIQIQALPTDEAHENYKPLFVSNLAVFTPPDPPPPNVILLIFDSLRADALGCHGSRDTKTPFLDRMAGDGVFFNCAISPSSWTLPAVASILTSKMPSQNLLEGLILTNLVRKLDTLPQLLSREGIDTGAVIYHLLILPKSNFEKGFQEFYVAPYSKLVWRNAEKAIADSLRWIEERRERPFFLYVHVLDPHYPHYPLSQHEFHQDYRSWTDIFEQILGFGVQVPHIYGLGFMAPSSLTEPELSALRNRYLSEVEYIDAQAGALERALRQMNLWENTLLIITSDHGEAFQEHGHIRHGHDLHRELIHVPLIFTGGLMEGRSKKFTMPVSTLDIFPTVLDFQGVKVPEGQEGQSLRDLIEANNSRHGPAYSEWVMPGARDFAYLSVVDGNYHLIKKIPVRSEIDVEQRLYQWDQDPGETHDIFKAEMDQARKLESKLDNYFNNLPGRYPLDLTKEKISKELKKRLRAIGYIE